MSSKCRPRNNAERFWLTVSPYQIRLSAFLQQIQISRLARQARIGGLSANRRLAGCGKSQNILAGPCDLQVSANV